MKRWNDLTMEWEYDPPEEDYSSGIQPTWGEVLMAFDPSLKQKDQQNDFE